MHILIVQETDWIVRNVIHQHHLIERLVRRGHRVDVIDYDILWAEGDQPGWWKPRQVFLGYHKVFPEAALDVIRPAAARLPLLCHLTWGLNSLREVRRFVHQDRPDIIIALTLTNSYPLALYAKKHAIPLVYMELEPYHSMVPQRWAQPVAKIVERLAIRRADRMLVFTPQMQDYVHKMGAQVRKYLHPQNRGEPGYLSSGSGWKPRRAPD